MLPGTTKLPPSSRAASGSPLQPRVRQTDNRDPLAPAVRGSRTSAQASPGGRGAKLAPAQGASLRRTVPRRHKIPAATPSLDPGRAQQRNSQDVAPAPTATLITTQSKLPPAASAARARFPLGTIGTSETAARCQLKRFASQISTRPEKSTTARVRDDRTNARLCDSAVLLVASPMGAKAAAITKAPAGQRSRSRGASVERSSAA
mmetsp:Transcript_107161/g.239239  ORF Transcript_107161/g.239239 Transcript_107161/m.239239 type:complete len:205 (+) Transcript_107161:780-1394(+)